MTTTTKTAEEIAAMRAEVEAFEAEARRVAEAAADKALKPVRDLLNMPELAKVLAKVTEAKAVVTDQDMLYNILNNIQVSAGLIEGQLQRTRSEMLS
jgi:hypothetical protein